MSVKFRYNPTLFPPMTEVIDISELKEKILKTVEKISKNDNGVKKMIIFWKQLKPLVSNINLLEIFPKISNQDYFFLTIYHLKYGLFRIWKNLFLDSPYDAEDFEFFKDFIEKLVVFIDLSLKGDTNNMECEKLIFSFNNFIIELYKLFYKKNKIEEKKHESL